MAVEFPWQQTLWAKLTHRPQYSHAYLFHGPQGTGKRSFAECLAAFWLCLQPQQGQACGHCKSCHLLKAGTHPDYMVLEPDEADKLIRVDQIRALVDFIGHTAQLNECKVVIIDPAEGMNTNAANALLKSLEEPAGSTRLLLISHQPSRLLPTIRSRCVSQVCPLPDAATAEVWLHQQQPELPLAERRSLLRLAGGAPLMALQLHQQGALGWRVQIMADLRALHQNAVWMGRLVEQWQEPPLLRVFDWFFDWLLQALRYQMTGDEGALLDPELHAELQALAQYAPASQILALQDWILTQRQLIQAKANLNRSLLLEALLARWSSLFRTG